METSRSRSIYKDADKNTILTVAKQDEKVVSFLENKEIVKEIYVPGKLVNFAVKP